MSAILGIIVDERRSVMPRGLGGSPQGRDVPVSWKYPAVSAEHPAYPGCAKHAERNLP